MSDSSLGGGEGLGLDLGCTFSRLPMRQKSVDLSSSLVKLVKSFGEEECFLIAIVATFLFLLHLSNHHLNPIHDQYELDPNSSSSCVGSCHLSCSASSTCLSCPLCSHKDNRQ